MLDHTKNEAKRKEENTIEIPVTRNDPWVRCFLAYTPEARLQGSVHKWEQTLYRHSLGTQGRGHSRLEC